MKESYVSYQQAKTLKELGFDWECDHFYTSYESRGLQESTMLIHNICNVSLFNFNFNEYDTNRHEQMTETPEYSAPSLSLAAKWLREVKGISIRVNYMLDNELWFADLLNIKTREYVDTAYAFGSYKEALADGIDTALTFLTEKQ